MCYLEFSIAFAVEIPSIASYPWISERHLRKHLSSFPFFMITGVVSIFLIFFHGFTFTAPYSLYFLTFLRLQFPSRDVGILYYGPSLVPRFLVLF